MKMKTLLTMLAIPATAAALFAQDTIILAQKKTAEAQLMAQGPVGMVAFSGEPGNFQFITHEFSIDGRPVTNAPYSADEKTESVQTLADGTRISNTSTAKVYRDSQGRTRRELTLPNNMTVVTIFDPVAGVNYTYNSMEKIARKMPSPMAGGVLRSEIGAKLKAEAESRAIEMRMQHGAAPGVTTSSTMEYRVTRTGPAREGVKREDLPATVIEGVSVTGTRETTVIDTGAMGNDRPITIASERWYSPELQIEVKSERKDPRMGVTTHSLSNISRAEPDPSVFQVPADYKVEEPKRVEIRGDR